MVPFNQSLRRKFLENPDMLNRQYLYCASTLVQYQYSGKSF